MMNPYSPRPDLPHAASRSEALQQYHIDPNIILNVTIHPDENWTILSDPVERRRVQNRIAQRGYRQRQKDSKQASSRTAAPSRKAAKKDKSSTIASRSRSPTSSISSSASGIIATRARRQNDKFNDKAQVARGVETVIGQNHHYEQKAPQVDPLTPLLDWNLSQDVENQTFSDLCEPLEHIQHQQYHSYLNESSIEMAGMNVHPNNMSPCAEAIHPSGVRDTVHFLDLSSAGGFPTLAAYSTIYESSSESDVESMADEDESKHIFGSTPLHRAAFHGHEAVIGTLIAAGADIEARNGYGLSALHLAALRGHRRIMTLLIGQGADMHARTQGGKTALHLAAKKGHEGVVWMLLKERGVDSNAQDLKGQTALHLACDKGHVGVVRVLIEWGADLGRRDYAERTPLQRGGGILKEGLANVLPEMGAGYECLQV